MVKIKQSRLDELLAKERAHDVYRAAIRVVALRYRHWQRPTNHEPFERGYGEALDDIHKAILDEDAKHDSLPSGGGAAAAGENATAVDGGEDSHDPHRNCDHLVFPQCPK